MEDRTRGAKPPYKTGQAIRYDAHDHLVWLARLPAFQMGRGASTEVAIGEPLQPLAFYGWRHVPANPANQDRLVDRPLGTARHKIASVLPPKMRGLSEMLWHVSAAELASFCERVQITGSHPLTSADQIERLQGAIIRRLDDSPAESDRKTIERLLARIDPVSCLPPPGDLSPELIVGQPVAVSASALHLGGSVVGIPSAAGWPVVGIRGRDGIEPYDPPTPSEKFTLDVHHRRRADR